MAATVAVDPSSAWVCWEVQGSATSGIRAGPLCLVSGQYDGGGKPLPEYHARIAGFDERVGEGPSGGPAAPWAQESLNVPQRNLATFI